MISRAGRDSDKYFIVVKIEENYIYLVDGDIRKIENPKKKKIKHIKPTIYNSENIAKKLAQNAKITNQDIKKALKDAILQ